MPPAVLRLPGFVNAHSHAFQRGLRGATERVERSRPEDDFWTWREAMYALAGALEPDTIHAVSRQAFAEMRAAGYTAVGEFHYPHHRPDGRPYREPNAMAEAVIAAANDAGIEIVLLMAAYARAGAGRGPEGAQRRFSDASAAAYLERVEALAAAHPGRVGLAPHSVRALPREWLCEIARYAGTSGMVVHVHACEQRREIEECLAEHGRRPIELLADTGLLGERTTVVHATHADDAELDLLAGAGSGVCLCPTTEANLGDGYLPALRLFRRGIRVSIGSDSNTILDPLAELRELEHVARRSAERRNVLVPAGAEGPSGYLLEVGTTNGARAIGLPGPPGEVEVDLGHPGLAGVAADDVPAALLFGGLAAALRPVAAPAHEGLTPTLHGG